MANRIEFILKFLRITLLSKLHQIIIIIYVNQEQWLVLLYANEHGVCLIMTNLEKLIGKNIL